MPPFKRTYEPPVSVRKTFICADLPPASPPLGGGEIRSEIRDQTNVWRFTPKGDCVRVASLYREYEDMRSVLRGGGLLQPRSGVAGQKGSVLGRKPLVKEPLEKDLGP